MGNFPETYQRYIYSGRLAQLSERIATLEDEFKICLITGQTERAALIESALGENYKSLMHEVRKQGLSTIDFTQTKVKITFIRTIFDHNI